MTAHDPHTTRTAPETATSDRGVTRPNDVETDVPDGVEAFTCGHCGRPFATEVARSLHLGLAHGASLTDDERDAYERAREDEEADLHRFRIIALGGLVALYFGFLFTYAVFA